MYCTLCQRKIEPVKSEWSWGWFLLSCLAVGIGGVIYICHHLFLKSKNRCPICKTKKLGKYSPEELELKRQKKEERNEKIKETFNSTTEKIKDTINQ